MPEATWDRLIAVNLTGQFYCVKYELQQFLKQGGGVIVNMSSLGGLKAEHGLVPYTAAKHGVLGITKNIAVQYAAQNIRANALCPYYVETPLLAAAPEAIHEAWIDGTHPNAFVHLRKWLKHLFIWPVMIPVIVTGHKLSWMGE